MILRIPLVGAVGEQVEDVELALGELWEGVAWMRDARGGQVVLEPRGYRRAEDGFAVRDRIKS
jgi:hypothetical protein